MSDKPQLVAFSRRQTRVNPIYSQGHDKLKLLGRYGPKRCRYSLETMNALTISAAW